MHNPLLKSLFHLALLAALLAATVAGLRTATPGREYISFTRKLNDFTDCKDSVDMVFIGTSRFHRAIDPTTLEAGLAARGVHLRSYNFGVRGLCYGEAMYVLSRILDQEPARLRYVVFETDMFPGNRAKKRDTLKSSYWREPQTLWPQLRQDVGGRQYRSLRQVVHLADLAFHNLKASLTNMLYIGEGPFLLQWAWDAPACPGSKQGEKGFYCFEMEYTAQEIAKWRPRNLKKTLAEKIKRVVPTTALGAKNALYIRDMLDLARDRGLRPLLMTMPGMPRRYKQDPELLHTRIINMNTPEIMGQALSPEHYFNAVHLNCAGGRRFSALLAERLATVLDQDASP